MLCPVKNAPYYGVVCLCKEINFLLQKIRNVVLSLFRQLARLVSLRPLLVWFANRYCNRYLPASKTINFVRTEVPFVQLRTVKTLAYADLVTMPKEQLEFAMKRLETMCLRELQEEIKEHVVKETRNDPTYLSGVQVSYTLWVGKPMGAS